MAEKFTFKKPNEYRGECEWSKLIHSLHFSETVSSFLARKLLGPKVLLHKFERAGMLIL